VNVAVKLVAKPKPPTWDEVVRSSKRDALLQAAREEFTDKGLEGATMRGIAARAGCTTGVIYPLFDSKEALYAALLDQSLVRLDGCVAQAVQAQAAPPDKVAAACRAFLAYYLGHPFEINLGLYAFRGLKPLGVGKHSDLALNEALERVLDRIALPFGECRGLPVKEVRPLMALLFSQMIGALVLHAAGRLKAMNTDADSLTRLMLDQLLPERRTRSGPRGGSSSQPRRR
jgi:AcrR family transcriptional regulator